ncbi:MAG: hypothetical protein M1826_007716 [Phylliscum demangeonii]|nr:MAG: hypothetical protein M1826_007716 [Phylliscum demangeonii]
MNGSTTSNGADHDALYSSSPNPRWTSTHDQDRNIRQIKAALDIVHNARSSPDSRRQASVYLEGLHPREEVVQIGMGFVLDQSMSAALRHFGLSVIERYTIDEGDKLPNLTFHQLRSVIEHVALHLNEEDPPYIRNKAANIWVELTERRWGSDWMDMDEQLCRLWSKSVLQKEFVAVVLKSLAEDVFNKEDYVRDMIGSAAVGRAYIEILTPAAVRPKTVKGKPAAVLRYGDEGWIARLANYLDECMPQEVLRSEACHSCVLKILAVLKYAMGGAVPKALAIARCVERVSKGLMVPDYQIQLALFCRTHLKDADFISLLAILFKADSVRVLRELYAWTVVDASDIDDDKYALGKKISEIIKSRQIGHSDAVTALIGPLMDTCSRRLLKYELLSEPSDNSALLFLDEDFDTMPERHVFIGNYRRSCMSVIEAIVMKRPVEALQHVLSCVEDAIRALYTTCPPLNLSSYTTHSTVYLQVDAQLTMFDAALKGYLKWIGRTKSILPKDEAARLDVDNRLEAWGVGLLDMTFEDPMIKKRMLQVAVGLATSAVKRESFVLTVLKHVFTTLPADRPEYPVYSDAVKEVQMSFVSELCLLAIKATDFLTPIYTDLEAKIGEIRATSVANDRLRISFETFLFLLAHRSTSMPRDLRSSRLLAVVQAIQGSWQDASVASHLESLEGFTELVGVGQAQRYLLSRQANQVQDWSSYALDDEGKAIQAQLIQGFERLPLRATKSHLGASLDKMRKDSEEYKSGAALWESAVPIILPGLLKFLEYSHAYYDTRKWASGSREMQETASRALTDRFWQSGISTGTKDDFYAKVNDSKATLEGLASSLRGVIRGVREGCYSVLYYLSQIQGQLYQYDELPARLAHALFADCAALTPQQFMTMISMMRFLTANCPPSRRRPFLTPVVSHLLIQIDGKIRTEWGKIEQRRLQEESVDEDNLTEEMKDESVLRQFTYASVTYVAQLLDPSSKTSDAAASSAAAPERGPKATGDEVDEVNEDMDDVDLVDPNAPPPARPQPEAAESSRDFVLSCVGILEPFLSFCAHILQVPDTRCCGTMLQVLKSITRDVGRNSTRTSTSPAEQDITIATREYLCGDILRAAITSFHDGRLVDVQHDLSTFIVMVYMLFSPLTPTPGMVLLSISGVTEHKLKDVHAALFAPRGSTSSTTASAGMMAPAAAATIASPSQAASQQLTMLAAATQAALADRRKRALMERLLEGVRGVSLSEQGSVKPRERERELEREEEKMKQKDERRKKRGLILAAGAPPEEDMSMGMGLGVGDDEPDGRTREVLGGRAKGGGSGEGGGGGGGGGGRSTSPDWSGVAAMFLE